MPTLSVIVITYNEEKNIERCLRSIRWVDEIIVVDSFSTDRTVELAKLFTSNIIQQGYDGEVPQRERGFAVASGDWLFWIDADEEVSEELQQEILSVLSSSKPQDGYSVPRKAYAFGKWIEHGGWFPDWQFRLVKKNHIVAEYQEIHGGFTTKGSKGYLQGVLHHYTYSNIAEYLRKLNDQTSLHVSNKLREHPDMDVRWHKIVFSPPLHFFQQYIVRKGYKDGFQGFLLAAFDALYTLALYSKLWEYLYRKNRNETVPPITNIALQEFKRRF